LDYGACNELQEEAYVEISGFAREGLPTLPLSADQKRGADGLRNTNMRFSRRRGRKEITRRDMVDVDARQNRPPVRDMKHPAKDWK
jgi:hypothetical protein